LRPCRASFRVTRLDKFLKFLKLLFCYFLFVVKSMYICTNFDEQNGLGYVLVNFDTNSPGHTG
jgi:hypothetical protein